MKSQPITLTTLLILLVACGTERPNPEDYVRPGTQAPATTTKTATTKTADASTTTTTPSTVTPAPNTTPAADATKPATTTTTPPPAPPAAVPTRTVPNAAELAAATAYYNTTCAGCHMPLATSAKKGLTPARLTAGKTAPAHINLKVDVSKWPEKDVTSNDGVENENLVVTAFLQVMK